MSRQKAKGSAGEREVAKVISNWIGRDIHRNLEASRGENTADIIFDFNGKWWLVEVKRREQLSKPSWYRQAWEHKEKMSESPKYQKAKPVVIYRRNREGWSVYWETERIKVDMGLWCWLRHFVYDCGECPIEDKIDRRRRIRG